jgi:hypothetical protein
MRTLPPNPSTNQAPSRLASRRGRACKLSNWPLTVTDGRATIGTVNSDAGLYVAIATDGAVLGRFATLSEATRAFGTTPTP